MIFIKQLGELASSDIDQAGGKAANLGELTRAGLPVPPGFVVLTEAYRAYIAEHQMHEQITALAAAASDDPAGYDEAAAQIKALFEDEVSDTLRTEIAEAYAALGEDVPVAVRSSATAEDLPEASFAGQQDTFLNVRGLDDLLVAVGDCWASLWTARAMAYRARQGIDPATVSLAVVVQQMVDAESAGVMFTANPSNGRRDETVISAAWGLGGQRRGQHRQHRGAYVGRHDRVQRDRRQSRDERLRRAAHPRAAGARRPAQTPRAQGSRGRRAGRVRNPHREPLRHTPRHRVGARGRKVLDPAGQADHRAT